MGLKKDLGMDIRYFEPKNPDTKVKMQEEFMKAVDLLTIEESNRLKKKLVEKDAVISENNVTIKTLMDDIQAQIKSLQQERR